MLLNLILDIAVPLVALVGLLAGSVLVENSNDSNDSNDSV